MNSRKTTTLLLICAAVLAVSATSTARAQRAAVSTERQAAEREALARQQEIERQQVLEKQRAILEQQAAERLAQQERLLASQREIAERGRDLAYRQGDLENARQELERSRREMEAAARKIAQLSAVQMGPFVESYERTSFGRPRVYIGATINDSEAGARVMAVTPGSPAAEAGVRTGDVIIAVNGVDVTASDRGPRSAVIDALGQIDPGATARLEVLRDGERQGIEVQTGESPFFTYFGGRNGNDFVLRTLPDLANLPGFFATRWRDMELVELSEGLGEYFGTGTGLLVVHAPANDDIGLRDGDVILEIGGRVPSSPEHAMRILTSFAPGETLELRIMRRQRRETIEYAIPSPDR